MSTRPRPVTATVTKPKWMEPHVTPRRSRSMESNGSTASLTSVLDHDSYISPDISDEEWHNDELQEKSFEKERTPKKIENESREGRMERRNVRPKSCPMGESNRRKESRKLKERRSSPSPKARLSDFDASEFTDDHIENLSPWEQWLIKKTREERVKRKEVRNQKKQQKVEKQIKLQEKVHQQQKAEVKRQEWLEKKTFEEKLRKRLEKQRSRTEKEIKDEQKRSVELKAERKYNEWLDKKEEEDLEKKRQEKTKKREEELARKCQEIKAKQKFEEWLREAKNRPKPVQNSFGYTSGKMTGMCT
ncbi:hypothetical protein FSP39_009444 [Pinctada imbricata]|uniref:Coiled-coil domain-containing protein n=1 Tax=Pinctada imbricata TaxID=66713 RepID=A0AA89CDW2_PINIB|nr:hypothetical protein FSP39_009444 [Pinctada imbricata]